MSEHLPFIQRALSGDVIDLREINADIDAWHETDTTEPLNEWLGMSFDEYALYVERPQALRYILQARKYGVDISSFLHDANAMEATALAARGASAAEVEELLRWLRKTGRLDS
jgi:hypothetical protein